MASSKGARSKCPFWDGVGGAASRTLGSQKEAASWTWTFLHNHPLWHPLLLQRGRDAWQSGAHPGGSRSTVGAPPLPAANRMAELSVKPRAATCRLHTSGKLVELRGSLSPSHRSRGGPART